MLLLGAWLPLAALAGCGGAHPAPLAVDGGGGASMLDARISVTALQSSPLSLQTGRLRIDDMTLYGDVTPSGYRLGSEVDLDVASPGRMCSFGALPQGVYSRIRFDVEHLTAQGSWRGRPLVVSLDGDELLVDLRSPSGVEVAPGQVAHLAIAVDPNRWFADNLLDSASVSSDGIVVDSSHNPALFRSIAQRVVDSFMLGEAATSLVP